MVTAFSRLGRAPSIALLVAAAWGSGLVVAGFVVPFYESETMSDSGDPMQATATLVGVNGPGVVVVLAVPLLATVLVACALLLRARRWAMPVAWALTAVLGVFNVLAIFTIGVFVVPVTVAVLVACVVTSGSTAGVASTA